MADPRRLGKPGAYRLGELDHTPQRKQRRRVPREVSLRRPRLSAQRAGWWLLVVAAATACVTAGAVAGLWFVPFVAGLAAGALSRRIGLRMSLAGVGVAAVAGWAIPLWWLALRGAPAGATARTVAALAGLPPYTGVAIAATLLAAALQALAGLWLARALTPRPR
jgi:hypothetical protein